MGSKLGFTKQEQQPYEFRRQRFEGEFGGWFARVATTFDLDVRKKTECRDCTRLLKANQVCDQIYLRRLRRTATKSNPPIAAKAKVHGSGTVFVNVVFNVAESSAVNVKVC